MLRAAFGFAWLYRESVHLCVPDWDSALLLLDVSGGGLVWLSLQPGARLNALETVSGRILAAHGALFLPEVKKVSLHICKKSAQTASTTRRVRKWWALPI